MDMEEDGVRSDIGCLLMGFSFALMLVAFACLLWVFG
jgi:hypothetical protein